MNERFLDENTDQHQDIVANNLLLKNARLIHPQRNARDTIDEQGHLLIKQGKIHQWAQSLDALETLDQLDVLDLEGAWITPQFIDLGTQLREPGYEHKGTLERESRAAYTSGFTAIAMLPDTFPVIDSPAVLGLIQDRAKLCPIKILPIAAMTMGLEGTQLSEIFALQQAGCLGVTQSRLPLRDNRLALRCLEYIATTGLKVFFYSNDHELAGDGVAHEGAVADRLGLPSIPECAETIAIARDLILVERTGVNAHFGHISSARSLELIEEAQAKGLPISADVSLAHLAFDESALLSFDPQFHIYPPLRHQKDRFALLDAVNRGKISISIGHQPQDIASKTAPFSDSAPGMSLYDTHISIARRLIDAGELKASAWVRSLSDGPAQVINYPLTGLHIGDEAAFNVMSDYRWTPNKQNCHSLGGNIAGFRHEQIGKLRYRVTGAPPLTTDI